MAFADIRRLDVCGLCLDEVDDELLATLRHPKICMLQLEVQSLDDKIRRHMHLAKGRNEVLAILDALSGKAIVSNLMTYFPGHSPQEFDRELRLVRSHHLYYLSMDVYDDTVGTPSHELYTPPTPAEQSYYYTRFLTVLAEERERLLQQLMKQPITASLCSYQGGTTATLYADHYAVRIKAGVRGRQYTVGTALQVQVTGLYVGAWDDFSTLFMPTLTTTDREHLHYFDAVDQMLTVEGTILHS